jgi:AcrR family transcriptional regulator
VGAVVLTQLARSVGVSPAAAYRHFPGGHDELLDAVAERARVELAERMRDGIRTSAAAQPGPVHAAMLRFGATGRAYVDFALEQPGLFELACLRDHDLAHEGGVAALLNACLDELVELGRLPAARRPRTEVAAWAAVHGLAVLLTTGPLAGLDPVEREAVIGRTLEVVGSGI